jgi:hypothetical protein
LLPAADLASTEWSAAAVVSGQGAFMSQIATDASRNATGLRAARRGFITGLRGVR